MPCGGGKGLQDEVEGEYYSVRVLVMVRVKEVVRDRVRVRVRVMARVDG